ncbi:unnamed protein product [Heligmosomoides polygyrus]|uniref:Uncharacterized protein n=1 Tax=Heligmosomoides polygyrus TaxID=6339 RepID=A0A183FID0_HELPZ|nr:unnamed protein product [Heligmosomoides polygyrus]
MAAATGWRVDEKKWLDMDEPLETENEDVRNPSHDVPGTQETCQRRRSTCLGIQVDVPKTSSNVPGELGVPKTSSAKGGSLRGPVVRNQ